MIRFPHCKINLGLHVIERRHDGFHNIETLFYPILLTDALEIIEAGDGETTFSQTGISIPSDGKKNLCERAYELLKTHYMLPPVKIHLHKHIPTGAGLGGGSSDATFTLLILNEIFKLNLSTDTLAPFAAQLGSDCSFFLYNEPCLATGRGENLQPLSISLKNYYILLIKPPLHVNTADAYAGIKPLIPSHKITDILQAPVSEWKNNLCNDFENTVFLKFPEIRTIKEKLYSCGALYASMSGSGATVFGLFETDPFLDTGSGFEGCFIWKSKL